MKPNPKIFVDGARLSAARIAAGFSIRDVAERIKKNRGTISKWEQGINQPSAKALNALAKLYGNRNFIIERGEESAA
jgi:transcriptional regulator with XRE-family HTH domain